MRNLKKILALVLALMMTLSLMVTASAATAGTGYSDDASITKYDEAVQVLDQLGVFRGNEKGEFAPDSTITRAEAAAIVYRIVSGDVNDTQTGIYADYNKFEDVPSTAWYAGYVNFVANGEYIQGDGQGHFYPMEKMTGYQLLAIILRAIGYGQLGEFEGTGWEIRTATQAKALGITNTITTGTLGSYITRAAVAEILFRGIAKTSTVNYTLLEGYKPTNKTLGYVMFGLNGASAAHAASGNAGLTNQVTRSTTASYGDYGEPYYEWYASTAYVADGVIEYYLNPVATYTTAVTAATLWAASGLGNAVTKANVTAHYEIDGKVGSNGNYTSLKYDDKTNALGGKGTVTELYALENGTAAIAVVNTYVDTVATTGKWNSITKVTTLTNWGSVSDTLGLTAALANSTVVLYTKYETASSGVYAIDVASIHAAKYNTLTPSAVKTVAGDNAKSYFKVGSTTYEYNCLYNTANLLVTADLNVAQDVYFDDHGYVVLASDSVTTYPTNIYILLDAEYTKLDVNHWYLTLTVKDTTGATKTVKAVGDSAVNGIAVTNADGTYKSSADAQAAATACEGLTNTLITLQNNAAGYAVMNTAADNVATGNIVKGDANSVAGVNVDNKTIFAVATYDADGNVNGYSFYTGIKQVPSLVDNTRVNVEAYGLSYITLNTTTVVLVKGAEAAAVATMPTVNTADYIYVIDQVPEETNVPYNEFIVIRNGAVTTVKAVRNSAADTTLKSSLGALVKILTVEATTNYIMSVDNTVDNLYTVSSYGYANDIIWTTMGSNPKMTLADNCVIVSAAGAAKTTADLVTGTNFVIVTDANGYIAYLIIE